MFNNEMYNALCMAVFKMIVNELNLIPKDQEMSIFTYNFRIHGDLVKHAMARNWFI